MGRKSKAILAMEQKWREQEDQQKRYIQEGKYVRIAALKHPSRRDPNVKVIFKGKNGEKAYWMTSEAYGHNFHEVTTVEDYPSAILAKNLDLYDGEDGTYALTYGPEIPMSQVPRAARRQTILARLSR
jgi:hypothetical protein